MKNKTIKIKGLTRTMDVVRESVDEDARTVELSFSSEHPVERYFGIEILGHKDGEVDLSRLESGRAPLLVNHWGSDQIGVVESAEITGKKGRAVVRFSKRAEAEAEFQDVLDGIRTCVSVGYRIRKLKLISEDEKTGSTYRAVDWIPTEVSLVSQPADMSVGIGRDDDSRAEEYEVEIINVRANASNENKQLNKEKNEMSKTAEELAREAADAKAKADAAVAEAAASARNDAVAEVREIIAIGSAHGMAETADEFIANGRSVQEFKDHVLKEMEKRGAKPVGDVDPNIGLTGNERSQFSFLRAIRALANPGNRAFAEDAAFEFECSRAVEDRTKRTAKGIFVPTDVLRHRAMNTQNDTQGGYLVENKMFSFIETLENSMVVKALGAVMLRDLVGDLSIPKQTGGATAYWIGETEDITESTPAVGQVALRPKGLGAYTDITRKMMLQSSIDMENFIRGDLALRLALAIDLAALSGSGASGQPLGIINTTGVGSVTLNAANTPDWGDIVDLESAVAVDNALTGSLAYTANATIQGAMKQTVKHATATVGFILDGKKLNGYPFYMSNQVAAKYMIFGNWRDMIIGQWSGVDINVDTSSLSKSGGTRIVAIQDVDVAVRHPESFAVGYKS
jgi:HK97 family phage major capsid protein